MLRLRSGNSRQVVTGLILVMLLLRAYVPAGFMPANGAPLRLQLCPGGMSMPAASTAVSHSPQPAHGHGENCPFGAVPAGGPVSQPPALVRVEQIAVLVGGAFPAPAFGQRPLRTHQPRGPPAPV